MAVGASCVPETPLRRWAGTKQSSDLVHPRGHTPDHQVDALCPSQNQKCFWSVENEKTILRDASASRFQVGRNFLE